MQHRVSQGESIATIARRYGFQDPKAIYDHPDNAALKKKRPSPDVLHPGDVVSIPEREQKSVAAATGKVHRFQLKVPRRVLRLAFVTHDGKPLANAGYTLSYGGEEIEGETDGDGVLEQPVPFDLDRATVLIDGDEHELVIGHLNPAKETPDDGVSGAQARLANLGYAAPAATGRMDDPTRAALRAFQQDHGLDASGDLDAATRDQLVAAHGV